MTAYLTGEDEWAVSGLHETEEALPPLPSGGKRNFQLVVDGEVVERVEKTVEAERLLEVGERRPFAFVLAAMRVAVEEARTRRHGVLPYAGEALPRGRRLRSSRR
ncbi:hypothetical protein [Dermatophilus congolensis]|uniref:hypothetical protein n=1 Tax=Dermatophilus congolensis TaxID=1863 RepID=UPI001AB05FDE|nr:hypothetical protein [Dermatophilus congolensis]MBO3182420.1 hypothetical protein [Dermatophilus congolensis]MBO3200431.1 hypothetical protein [Dermatophilus congolensis]MBO3211737.1 hypothetical protein [Dermatophilus congolensis]